MPLILPGNVGSATAATGFNVANSVRFQNAQLGRTSSSTSATNIDKYTISVWVKRSKLGADQNIISLRASSYYQIYFKSDDTLRWQEYLGGSSKELITNRKFRDVGAWYHIVCRYDSSLGTAGDRMRIYINGVEETSFATDANPDQNANGHFGVASTLSVIADNNGDGREYFGYMCEFMGVDGQSLAPTEFGEFDSDNGIWKPIDISGITQGVHGFYLKFEDSSDLGVATLGSDWTGAGLAATDQSTDTCTNNFATMNPLALRNNPSAYYVTFSEGNLKVVGNDATNNGNGFSTMGFSSGKWYCEVKVLSVEGSLYPIIGVVTENSISNGSGNNGIIGQVTSDTVGYANDGEKVIAGTESSYGDTYTDNDIIGIAIDCDNGAVYFSKNGTFQASGDPTSGASKTNAAMTFTPSANYFFGVSAYKSTSDVEFNFGSPPYAISSGNADGDGHGNFEFAVPSGYFSLNTKNLAEYG